MPRRIKKSKSIFTPLTDNFFKKISTSDQRLKRKLLKTGFILVGLFFLFSLFSSTYGVKRIISLHLEKNTLTEMNREAYIKLIDGNRMKHLLLHDRDFIEYIARTRYHMVYPGETVYRYQGQ